VTPTTAPTSPPAEPQPVQLGSVRQLYAELLRLGERSGARRAAATTPLEHVPALHGRLEPEQTVDQLTDAYVQVRYAETELPAAVAAELRDQLAQVHPKHAPE
jgi:hypothetical protein